MTTTKTALLKKKTHRVEPIYVLYGSQTGNAEQAAKDLCEQIGHKLSPRQIQALTTAAAAAAGGGRSNKEMDDDDDDDDEIITVEAVHMQLDDFLELRQAAWTRLIVIFCSSYGVGQAPLGAYRFRDLCDAWMLMGEDDDEKQEEKQSCLDGVYFALCGLGDSKFTTFFQNPQRINDALLKVGAKRAGPLGKADACGTGKKEQQVVIQQWMDGIWKHLAEVVVQEPLTDLRLKEMQKQTVAICRKINPDFLPEPKKSTASPAAMLLVAILVALVAVVAYYLYK